MCNRIKKDVEVTKLDDVSQTGKRTLFTERAREVGVCSYDYSPILDLTRSINWTQACD